MWNFSNGNRFHSKVQILHIFDLMPLKLCNKTGQSHIVKVLWKGAEPEEDYYCLAQGDIPYISGTTYFLKFEFNAVQENWLPLNLFKISPINASCSGSC